MPTTPRRRRLPPFTWLRAFESAARHLSFTEAGEELAISQAAVSQQVRQLEDWLGAPLFKRLVRGLALTDAGIAYLPIVRDGIDRLDMGTEQIFGRLGRRPVTLRATATMAALWLARRLADFRRAHPEITLRVTTLYAPVDFGQDGIDVEIRYGDGKWPGVEARKLFDETYFPVCSGDYLRGAPSLARPADLARHRLIHTLGEREGWGAYFQQSGVAAPPLSEGLQCDSLIVALEAAAAGGGVALATAPIVEPLLASGRLVEPLQERLVARYAHHVVVPAAGAPSREVQLVVGWLLDAGTNAAGGEARQATRARAVQSRPSRRRDSLARRS
jgi:LysR family glycine cleavage system transcriptional activator